MRDAKGQKEAIKSDRCLLMILYVRFTDLETVPTIENVSRKVELMFLRIHFNTHLLGCK